MWNIHILLICVIKVYVCAEYSETTTVDIPPQRVWQIEELYKLDEDLFTKYEKFSDGAPPLSLPASEVACYENNQKCLKEQNTTASPVCSHLNNYGFVSFPVVCDIYLKNCLIKAYEEKHGHKYARDTFYYNEQGRDCDYYVSQGNSMSDAIKLYFIHGSIRRYMKP